MMVRIILTTLVVALIPAQLWAGGMILGSGQVVAGGDADTFIGWPNSSGTPSSDPGEASSYGAPVVQTCAIVATEGGTAVWVNPYIYYISGTVTMNAVLYIDGTRVGYGSVPTPTSGAWQGEIELTAVSGQDLNFESGDRLQFGFECDDGTGSSYATFGRATSGGIGLDYNIAASWVDATDGMGTSVTFTTAGSGSRLGSAVLGYR